jgi:hypothetical protein
MLTTQNAPDLATVGWQFLATVVLYPSRTGSSTASKTPT